MKYKNPVILSVIHHRQNPLESIYVVYYLVVHRESTWRINFFKKKLINTDEKLVYRNITICTKRIHTRKRKLCIQKRAKIIILPIYGSTFLLLQLDRFSVFKSYAHSVGLLGRGISPSQGAAYTQNSITQNERTQTPMP
jgi:hypothetical protein